ncbi:M23 family metallopeptidase [Allosphingosinicella deserti]|uniref:M23ase beta-sheet core domain-containing protein n=1 Tax=Allosphingosinicella deserti TaxID=2116704 RepID=A0A2P7QYT7_9SPHN|nr:M23 family metallopeptidase [Sphingomonas deserti]PSJ43126.1 hypothetical protein C7I55_01700 [Sphingomonas deserti]
MRDLPAEKFEFERDARTKGRFDDRKAAMPYALVDAVGRGSGVTRILYKYVAVLATVTIGISPAFSQPPEGRVSRQSEGSYRLPYADGTTLSVFDDADTHRPGGALDLIGEPRTGGPHRIVAAADGTIMALVDRYKEKQSGRAAELCRNNYLWLSHVNGEWTLHSHMRSGSSSAKAGLKVGDKVRAGQYLGDEGDVGCAMLSHLHFEVAVPTAEGPIDARGFLTDNVRRERMRLPRFCSVAGEYVRKDTRYTARACK